MEPPAEAFERMMNEYADLMSAEHVITPNVGVSAWVVTATEKGECQVVDVFASKDGAALGMMTAAFTKSPPDFHEEFLVEYTTTDELRTELLGEDIMTVEWAEYKYCATEYTLKA
jgi:hypothetical protein